MEVVLHYRPSQFRAEELHKLAAGSLEEYPVRHLPRFVPWFPFHKHSFTLKPKTPPPFISEVTNLCDAVFEDVASSKNYDSTFSLLEFQPNITNKENVMQDQMKMTKVERKGSLSGTEETSGNEKTKLRRAWTICTASGGTITPPSEELRCILHRLKLNIFHRGRWTIPSARCGYQSLDETWLKLNQVLRHHFLPCCNATLRRDIHEIWVFCDLRNSEHTGLLLKTELKLTGSIDLFVHKHGIILSL